jgi:hypothetical protein
VTTRDKSKFAEFTAVHTAWDEHECDAPACEGKPPHHAAYFISRRVNGMTTRVRPCLEATLDSLQRLQPPNESAVRAPAAGKPFRTEVYKVR